MRDLLTAFTELYTAIWSIDRTKIPEADYERLRTASHEMHDTLKRHFKTPLTIAVLDRQGYYSTEPKPDFGFIERVAKRLKPRIIIDRRTLKALEASEMEQGC